jgi:hypothetical protein
VDGHAVDGEPGVSRIASLVGSDAEVEPMLSPVPHEVAVGEQATLQAVLGDERESLDPAAECDGVAFGPSIRALRRGGRHQGDKSGHGPRPLQDREDRRPSEKARKEQKIRRRAEDMSEPGAPVSPVSPWLGGHAAKDFRKTVASMAAMSSGSSSSATANRTS